MPPLVRSSIGILVGPIAASVVLAVATTLPNMRNIAGLLSFPLAVIYLAPLAVMIGFPLMATGFAVFRPLLHFLRLAGVFAYSVPYAISTALLSAILELKGYFTWYFGCFMEGECGGVSFGEWAQRCAPADNEWSCLVAHELPDAQGLTVVAVSGALYGAVAGATYWLIRRPDRDFANPPTPSS